MCYITLVTALSDWLKSIITLSLTQSYIPFTSGCTPLYIEVLYIVILVFLFIYLLQVDINRYKHVYIMSVRYHMPYACDTTSHHEVIRSCEQLHGHVDLVRSTVNDSQGVIGTPLTCYDNKPVGVIPSYSRLTIQLQGNSHLYCYILLGTMTRTCFTWSIRYTTR